MVSFIIVDNGGMGSSSMGQSTNYLFQQDMPWDAMGYVMAIAMDWSMTSFMGPPTNDSMVDNVRPGAHSRSWVRPLTYPLPD